jgi:hypothetical protein
MEVQLDIFKERGLISLDGEMIMRSSIYQILRKFSLCQKSVGSDDFAFDINGVKQWRGCFDFVGAFCFFITFGGQGTYFFCV